MTAGSLASANSAGASLRARVAQRDVWAGGDEWEHWQADMIALLYDVHGNLPALEAVIDDAGEVDEWVIGGDVALFGPWPAETVARLRELPAAHWLRGNGERWVGAPRPGARRPGGPGRDRRRPRDALGPEVVAAARRAARERRARRGHALLARLAGQRRALVPARARPTTRPSCSPASPTAASSSATPTCRSSASAERDRARQPRLGRHAARRRPPRRLRAARPRRRRSSTAASPTTTTPAPTRSRSASTASGPRRSRRRIRNARMGYGLGVVGEHRRRRRRGA